MIDVIYNYRQGILPTVSMSEEWKTLYIKFEEILTDEQLTIFRKLCDLQSATLLMIQEQLTRQVSKTA